MTILRTGVPDPDPASTASIGAEQGPEPKGMQFHLYSYLLGLGSALALTGGALLLVRQPDPPPLVVLAPPTPTAAPTATPTATPGPIVVYVSGAVRAPGLVQLSPGARAGEAIAAAGGLIDAADPATVNQAQLLFDGAQVHVPGNEPAATPRLSPVAGISGVLPTPTPVAAADAPARASALINLNTATQAELESLPGIGPGKAVDIIAARPYQSVDALDDVPGIGAATLERLRPLVTAP
ncbi:MAG: helix-hairpin-helix domain-containing protein [Anaerolineales bacterium]|nr:helix-hairpin-helix domain-containing protein [Anaerolineales bacterium]